MINTLEEGRGQSDAGAAGLRSMETLLNCYCREVARPAGNVSVGPLFGHSDWPMALRTRLAEGQAMHIRLPHVAARLVVVVEADAPSGHYRYRSALYYKGAGQPWRPLCWEKLAIALIDELSRKYDRPFNDELLSQIRDSVATLDMILQGRVELSTSGPRSALESYIDSEQSLHYGHPFHPAPKSRQGFSKSEILRYSPELGARVALHYFAVRRECYVQRSLLDRPCDEVVAAHAPAGLDLLEDFALLPVHPWQARHLLGLPQVRKALRQGRLMDMGCRGASYFATSSVRTVFHPDNPYFYKLSLNVRLTNCVRKNAIYELDGALQVTRTMRALASNLSRRFPRFRVLEEPAYQTADFGRDPAARREVRERFSMILRQGLGDCLAQGVNPYLAGALFGNHVIGRERLTEMVQGLADREGMPVDRAARRWFEDYVAQLLPPVLYSYFAHGLIFEPHLQNVLIGLEHGKPSAVVLRDFEGVKLAVDHPSAQRLDGLDQQAREALLYDAAKGWNRIAYCLFVNNLGEAIEQMSAALPVASSALWAIVREQLWDYQQRHGDSHSAQKINSLIAGQPLPAKANLINRFFMRPDRSVEYIPLFNPLVQGAGCRA